MGHDLRWYVHRLRAMSGDELRAHLRRRLHQRADRRRLPDWSGFAGEPAPGRWPQLPSTDAAPPALREALRHEADELLAGRWRAFGHVVMRVDDPPRWFKDHLADVELPTGRWGFQLNHRDLPHGADSKLVWEPSRWHGLLRLAQAGWLLDDAAARDRCVAWLADWARWNKPFLGWNWTSALESGMRLLAFAWLDALLAASGVSPAMLAALRKKILPAHAWFTWRYQSFGSSANNHLIGELAGLIAAVARWPELARWSAGLPELHAALEREILGQFGPDGGNREQALNYHLFSLELCGHARAALRAAGMELSAAAEERLRRAADFFATVQVGSDRWDYGDSDSAVALPLTTDDVDPAGEWWRWLQGEPAAGLQFWLGDAPAPLPEPACRSGAGDWLDFPDAGQAVAWSGPWVARLDVSPLGYLRTASHGHLDALHFSLWLGDVALVVDPGTGAYYADARLRAWLASWAAHNGPHVPGADFPPRLGPFLWGGAHLAPAFRFISDRCVEAELRLPQATFRRRITRRLDEGRDGWQVDDFVDWPAAAPTREFLVAWQFAPGTRLVPDEGKNENFLHGERAGARFTVGLDAAWWTVQRVEPMLTSAAHPWPGPLPGVCSPAFRRVQTGPRLELRARGDGALGWRTTFLLA
ncbi:MAG: heparinase II/III family protein [Limisphaerales bacterium]